MKNQTQQEYLQAAKAIVSERYPDTTWDKFAERCGITPRAFKTYRMPEGSKDYRTMNRLAMEAVERVVKACSAKSRKSL